MKAIKFLFYILIAQVYGMAPAFASSGKTVETSLVGNLGTLVAIYKNDFQKLPTSWSDIMDAGSADSELWKPFKDALDFERRYRFLDPSVTVVVHGDREKIVVMAVEPGREGNRGEDPNEAGRWLIVEMGAGDIQTRNYSEVQLTKFFARAGYDLRDYSNSKGKWSEVKASSQTDPVLPPKESPVEIAADRKRKFQEIEDFLIRAERTNTVRWVMGGVSIFAIVMLVAIWKRWRKRREL